MALLPKVKLKAMPNFPSRIIDGTGVDVERIHGAYKIDLAFDDFAPPASEVTDAANQNALLWNSVTGAYVLAPITILSGSSEYDPPGTGAVDRTVKSRLDDFISAANWPLICDGLTDMTVMVQQMLDTGFNIYFPPMAAACLVRTVTMSTAKQQLILSPGFTFLLKAGTTAPLLTITGRGCGVTGGKFDGNRTAQGTTVFGQGLINIVAADYVRISKVNIVSAYSDSITFNQSNYGVAEDNAIDLSYGVGIHAWYGSNWCNIHGNTITRGAQNGIYATGPEPDPSLGSATACKYATMVNNVVDYSDTTVFNTSQNYFQGLGVWGCSSHATITGNVIRGPNAALPAECICWGITVSASADYSTVTGNSMSNNLIFGIEVSDTSYNTVTGNTITDALDGGIDIVGSGDRNTLTVANNVSNNSIRNCTTGILVYGKAPDTNVQGNTIVDAITTGIAVLKGADTNGPYGSNIIGNVITSWNLPINIYQGISVASDDVNIANNQLKFLRTSADNQQGAFQIRFGGQRVNIVGNVLASGTGVSLPGIIALTGGGSSNITGNIGYRLSGFMIDTSAGTGNNLVSSNLGNVVGAMLNGATGDTAANNKVNP